MPMFATPDFGATGAARLVVFAVGAILLILAYSGFYWGASLIKHGPLKARLWGACLVVVSGLLPVLYLAGPSIIARWTCGHFLLCTHPNNQIKKGMSKEEVAAILGSPHDRHPYFFHQGEGEGWLYYFAPFGTSFFGIEFGHDGRVMNTYGE